MNKNIDISSSIGGEFTIANTALAAAAALISGVGAEEVSFGIKAVDRVKGRIESVVSKKEEGFEVFIDYAHTPSSLKAALVSLRQGFSGRLVCLFGCGGERDREKRPEMGRIAERYSDKLIITSDNPRREDAMKIIEDIVSGLEGKREYTVICNRRDAIRKAVLTAEKGDRILLSGKGHEEYEIVGGEMRPFCEEEEVKKALEIRKTNGLCRHKVI